jgi:hypothetical protein
MSGEISHGTYWIGDWLGSGADMESVEEKISSLAGIRTSGLFVVVLLVETTRRGKQANTHTHTRIRKLTKKTQQKNK